MTDTDTMRVEWEPTTRRTTESLRKTVRLTDAPEITASGRQCRPDVISFEFLRIDGGAWRSQVTIYASHRGSLIRKFFGPDKVVDMPQWLADLIEQATPKDGTE